MTKYEPAARGHRPSRRSRRPARRRSRAPRARRAPPVRSCDRVDLPAVGDHGVVRAELLGELERVRVAVHHDDPGRGQRGQALDADVAEAARADHHAGGARVEQRDGLADRVVGGDAGVGEGGDVLGLGLRVELDAGPGRGEQVLGHAAVAATGRGTAVLAVHVVAGPAGAAQPAGRGRVQDDRVADGHVGDRRADLVHPAGVLVAEDVGQRRCASPRPTGPR